MAKGRFQQVFPKQKFWIFCFFGIPTHSAALFQNSDSLCSAFLEFLLTLQRFFGNPTHSAALFWKPYSLCSAFLEILLTLQPFTRKSDSICSAFSQTLLTLQRFGPRNRGVGRASEVGPWRRSARPWAVIAASQMLLFAPPKG